MAKNLHLEHLEDEILNKGVQGAMESIKNKKLKVNILSRGSVWLDTGTISALNQANSYVKIIEERQGRKIGCIEEAAFAKGLIDKDQLLRLAKPLMKSGYGKYLESLIL